MKEMEPNVCTPLVGETVEEIINEVHAIVPQEPDIIEWRADYFKEVHNIGQVETVLEKTADLLADIPLLFTIRSEKEGGQPLSLREDEKIEILKEVSRTPYVEFIDYEVDNSEQYIQQLRSATQQTGTKLILSYHNFNHTPDDSVLLKALHQAEFYKADYAKLAVMPQSNSDVLQLLMVTEKASSSMDIPLITISMGGLGIITRMFGWVFGSSITFAVGEKSSAPGQIPLKELKDVIELTKKYKGDS
ncbi:type I 3-dehydroquinate dehydratase [Halobacillus andaensis]|uniref:type I 3-dehydroquinate dehydratase n=1 Tax=Halobacillus andaensis TaxID=1176239 RepID=UPI003D73259E